jgi:hypothetical protein
LERLSIKGWISFGPITVHLCFGPRSWNFFFFFLIFNCLDLRYFDAILINIYAQTSAVLQFLFVLVI